MNLVETLRLSLWKRFKECYERRAIDNAEEKIVGREERIVFSIRNLPIARGRVLDVGSADGLLLEAIGTNQAIGSDVSLEYCRKMKSRGIEVVNCAAEYIPFTDDIFDTVICTEVLEHVLYPEQAIHEIYRVLRIKSHALFSVPFMENIATYGCCNYEFAHLRKFSKRFAYELSRSFNVISVNFYGFRIYRIRLRSYLVSKITSLLWKGFMRFIPYKFLQKFHRIRPLCLFVLVSKPRKGSTRTRKWHVD